MSENEDTKKSKSGSFFSGEPLVLPEDDSIIERKRREAAKPKRKWYSYTRRYSELKKAPPQPFAMPTIETNDHIRNIFASSISSSLSRAVAQPFDRLKQKLQQQHYPHSDFKHNYQSMYHAASVMYIEKGIPGFWKGHTIVQTVSLFQSIALFYSYEMLLSAFLTSPIGDNSKLCNFMCGFVAGAISVIATHPMEEIKLRQLARRKIEERFSYLAEGRQAFQNRGLRSCYYNFIPSLVHNSSLYGCKFMVYNMCCDQMLMSDRGTDDATSKEDLDGWELVTAGAISGIVSNYLTNPFELVKKRLGMPSLERQHYRFDATCRTFFQCCAIVVQREGFLGFYKGVVPNAIRSMVFTAVQFSAFDKVRKWADNNL